MHVLTIFDDCILNPIRLQYQSFVSISAPTTQKKREPVFSNRDMANRSLATVIP